MARFNTLAASQVLFVAAQPTTGNANIPGSQVYELFNIQSFNWDYNSNLEPIYALGKRADIGRDSVDPPEITLSFEYYITNFDNENRIGLVCNGSSGVLAKIFNGAEDEKMYFNAVAPLGVDGIGSTPANNPCLGFGNAVISSYAFSASVGNYPTSTVNLTALGARGYLDSVAESPLPSVDTSTGLDLQGTFTLPTATGNIGRDAIIRPGDIIVDFSTVSGLFYNLSGICVQSIDIDFDLGRENRQCLGNRYARSRDLGATIDLNTSITFQAPDIISGSVSNYFCQTGLYNANVIMRRPACFGTGNQVMKFDIRGMRLNHEGAQVGLGNDGTTITLDFVSSIGSAADTVNNLYLSGSFLT